VKIEIIHNGKVVISKDLAEGSYKIGRAPDCDLVLDSNKVSKHHALLVIKGNRAAIVDTGSSNGVFVNGFLIKKQLLKSSDVVDVGDFTLKNVTHRQLKRNLEVNRTQGNVALEADPLDEPLLDVREEALVEPEPTSMTRSANFLSFIDQKLLFPFYEIIKVTDYRFILAIILTATLSMATFFSVTPILNWGTEITKRESLKRGQAILKQVVRENYRILSKSNDTTLLSVTAADSDKDMLDVYIMDTGTKSVLAPTKFLGKSINDPYVLLALEDILEKQMEETLKDRGDGTFVLAESIPYFGSNESIAFTETENNQSKIPTAIVIGYFKLPKNLVGIYEPLVVSGMISLLLALGAFFFLFKMISYPVGLIGEQLDSALKGDDVEIVCRAKFPELETLTTVINFAVSRLKSAGGGNSEVPSGVPGGFDTQTEEQSYLKIIEEFCVASTDAILLLDRDKKIKYVSPVLADLFSLRPQYALGQNIGDACRDGSFAGTVIDMAERVVSSLGESQTASLDVNGVARSLSAVGHRYSNGEIGFIIITVKMNG